MIPGKIKFLLLPLLILSVICGSGLFIWGGSALYLELQAHRDAEDFSAGEYGSVTWFLLDDFDDRITGQTPAVHAYNYGIMYFSRALKEKQQMRAEALLGLAAFEFREAFTMAEEAKDEQIAARAASALGAMYIVLGVLKQDPSYLEQADAVLVRAVILDPDDQDARWNLELLRRLYSSMEGKEGEPDEPGPPTGPGRLDPGKGGL